MSSDLSPVALRPFAAHRGEFVDRLDGELASDGGDALELVPTEAVDEIGLESGDGDVARARGPRERRARRAHLFFIPRMADDPDARLDAIDLARRGTRPVGRSPARSLGARGAPRSPTSCRGPRVGR